jgi:hypothetical protein
MASMKASVCLDINGNELKVTPDRNRKKLSELLAATPYLCWQGRGLGHRAPVGAEL